MTKAITRRTKLLLLFVYRNSFINFPAVPSITIEVIITNYDTFVVTCLDDHVIRHEIIKIMS